MTITAYIVTFTYIAGLLIGLIATGLFADINNPDRTMPLILISITWPLSTPVLLVFAVFIGGSMCVVFGISWLKNKVIEKLRER